MEQIETQASDLRYLAQTPLTLSDSASGAAYETPQPQPLSPGSASIGDNSAPASAVTPSYHYPPQHQQQQMRSQQHGGSSSSHEHYQSVGKRKSPDDDGSQAGGNASGKQTRSKRNRYISIACNECKRRKIKCNGETPCQRCGHLNLICLYAPNCCSSNFKESDEYKAVTSQLARLQDEVKWVTQTLRTLQDERQTATTAAPDQATQTSYSSQNISPSQASAPQGSQSRVRPRSFRGPTSMTFALDVANNTITNMGCRDIMTDGEETAIRPGNTDSQSTNSPPEPLVEFSQDELIHLCEVHENEFGIMYPVLDIQSVIAHAKNLVTYLEGVQDVHQLRPINDTKTLELKVVLCCALTVEDHGDSARAKRLYESMENTINKMMMSEPSDVSALGLLALVAGYRFLCSEEILAWRAIGQVTRLCLELGLHQSTGLARIQDPQERKIALNSFWAAYVLDRRWAFITGLPYVVQDDDIDQNLPMPDGSTFLLCMIDYSRMAAKVWRQVSHFEPVLARDLPQQEMERLDSEIMHWYESIPDEIKVRNWNREKHLALTSSLKLQRLRIWTYLRFNQLRTWLYTPILHSATSIMGNPVQAQRAVDLAKDTIHYLNYLNNTTDHYRRLQGFYHQFLASAIAVVFLASVHAPVRFSAVCREEFYLALDLVKGLSAKSTISQRLWRTIRTLKMVAPSFGLNADDDPHSSAALGMVGLATGVAGGNDRNNDGQNTFQKPALPNGQAPAPVDQNGMQIRNEMTRIFEGFVSLDGFQHSMEGQEQGGMSTQGSGNGMYGVGGGATDATVYPHFREMF